MSAREGWSEAVALRDAGRFEEAVAVMRRTAEAHPGNAEVRHNLGVLLSALGRPAEAEPHFRAALAVSPDNPDIRYAFAVSLLAQGRFAEGWAYYDGRLASQNIPVPRGFPFPRWAGEDPAGKTIAVFPEQGYGDQIQFARFAATLQARGSIVILLARPALVDLFKDSLPGVTLLSAEGAVDFPDPDFWVMSSDLAALAGCTLATLSGAPYLRTTRRWQGSLPPGFRIGIATRGNPHFAQDKRRSLDPASADLLRASLPGAVVSLDPAESGAGDFADTAALIDALDLVIAVDTGVAHLAGALGKPCFVLLQGFGSDWRWLLERGDSPWYASVSLYRAPLDGDWRPAIERAAADARRLAAPRTHGEIQAAFPADPMDAPGARRSHELMEQAYRHRSAGRIAEALAASHAAIAANPANPGAVHNLGVLLSQTDRLEEGEAVLRRALELSPGQASTRHSLGLNLLRQGRYREGWQFHRARTEIPELTIGYPSNVPFAHWEGEPLAGKRLAVFPEQGFGDQIQLVRFVAQVQARGAAITLLTPPALLRLFRHNLPGVEVIAADGSTDFPDPDFWATLLDLPGLLGITLETIPQPPYLRAPGRWGNAPQGFTIGLATRGDPKLANDSRRSLDAATAERLRARLPGTVVSLDPASSGARDFADTAAMIEALDAVVCVDTSVAHLAGALGKRCFVLIPGYATDWRWLRERSDSPWYPSVTLYRDTPEGGWAEAIERLAGDVEHLSRDVATRAAEASAQAAEVATRELIQRADELVTAGLPREALRLFRAAADAAPADASAQRRLGIFLTRVGEQAEGECVLRRAMALGGDDPEYPFALGLNLFGQGRYPEGWPLYEARARVGGLRTGLPVGLPCPRWRGEPIAGKRITIVPEQGLGDQLQFARFIPDLVARGARVTLLAFAPLATLFAQSFPGITVLPAGGATKFPPSDYWTTLIEMFGLSGATTETLPQPVYLSTPERADRKAEGFTIGLVTSGAATLANDARRSLAGDVAQALRARLPGTIVGLDPAESGAADFAATAAIIGGLDLVVSVDTAAAHLAGALGKQCLLLLPGFATDWRWMRGRDDSPWYPAHRLYRGAMEGDWSEAIDRLVRDAHALAGERRAPAPAAPAPVAAPPTTEDWDKALRLSRKAAAQNPRHAGAQLNLAKLLTHLGRTAGGEQAFRRALALAPDSPDIRYALALNLLEQGRYAEAWPLHEARSDVPTLDIGFPRGVPFARWQGEELAGRSIAVLPEQGFGDQIQFARFVPELAARGAAVTVVANRRLETLFRDSFDGVTIVRAQGELDIAPDYWATMVDLPARLGATLETLPQPPYLRVRETAPRAPGVRIGLMTNGNPAHRRDRTRSLTPEAAALLRARLPGAIVSLDPRDSGARDFAETAAIIDRLDLVVSVDTSVAHLAGALGKPCFVLISEYGTDWRWLRDRADSPWYPSLTVFRGGIGGNWNDAIERLAAAAHALAG